MNEFIVVSIPGRNEEDSARWGVVSINHHQVKGLTNRTWSTQSEARFARDAYLDLISRGMRLANENESGWYVLARTPNGVVKVWATEV